MLKHWVVQRDSWGAPPHNPAPQTNWRNGHLNWMMTFATTSFNQQRSGQPIHDTMVQIELTQAILLYSQPQWDQLWEIRDIRNRLIYDRDGCRIKLTELATRVTAVSAKINLITALCGKALAPPGDALVAPNGCLHMAPQTIGGLHARDADPAAPRAPLRN